MCYTDTDKINIQSIYLKSQSISYKKINNTLDKQEKYNNNNKIDKGRQEVGKVSLGDLQIKI